MLVLTSQPVANFATAEVGPLGFCGVLAHIAGLHPHVTYKATRIAVRPCNTAVEVGCASWHDDILRGSLLPPPHSTYGTSAKRIFQIFLGSYPLELTAEMFFMPDRRAGIAASHRLERHFAYPGGRGAAHAMANSSQPLLAALSDASSGRNFIQLVESYLEPQSRGQFCNICIFIDVLTGLFENSMQSQLTNGPAAEIIRDLDLGRRSDLLARSSSCLTCRTLLSYAEEHIATSCTDTKSLFATDYTFSAHLADDNPVLAIAFGTTSITTANARERRSFWSQLGVLRFLSTDSQLPMSPSLWPPGSPHLYNPVQVDAVQIKAWLSRCEQEHGAKCRQPKAQYVRSEVRTSFIDVEQGCIVTPSHVVPYVALSYVWGSVETLQATKGNIDELSCPGSLLNHSEYPVPATIRDAIKLCALVGQRYLWVDRVCIVQDDFDAKNDHLNAMAQTYANAEFTIVAADGSHADEGLAGLGYMREQRRRHLVRFPTKTRIRVSEAVARQKRLSENVWSTRAWTFQEHVFSRRLLYMDKLANWICYSATWNEAWSLPPATVLDEDQRVDQHGKGEKLYTVDWPSFAEYAKMVEQYNSRQLSYDSDILNAFLGIMAQMCEGFPAGFHGGLPEFYFTIGLLWQPGEGLRPRFPSTRCAPSWSWLGWSGKLDLTMWRCNTDAQLPQTEFETTISPAITLFKTRDRADTVSSRIDDTFYRVRTHFLTNKGATPDRWQKHSGDASSNFQPYYTYLGYNGPSHIDTKRNFRYPIPPFQRHRDINPIQTEEQTLYFSAQRKFFTIGKPEVGCLWRFSEHKDERYYAVDVPIFDNAGMWAGSVRFNARDNVGVPIGEKVEMVRIAEGSIPTKSSNMVGGDMDSSKSLEQVNRHPFEDCVSREELRSESVYDFYFVLWVERDGEVARRRALGTVWKPFWNCGEADDIDITLV
ncbi:hypothetical protein OPT61_g3647 [Boeremia exigua]|uniref:Uncharacterized protein n=1 Tax=Boeremia exigua TaxID=749465 RepID=A0ACC2IH84_9PLEO|nr:hypothetical protein OPT61_g3647 [Boeremia exigua]